MHVPNGRMIASRHDGKAQITSFVIKHCIVEKAQGEGRHDPLPFFIYEIAARFHVTSRTAGLSKQFYRDNWLISMVFLKSFPKANLNLLFDALPSRRGGSLAAVHRKGNIQT